MKRQELPTVVITNVDPEINPNFKNLDSGFCTKRLTLARMRRTRRYDAAGRLIMYAYT